MPSKRSRKKRKLSAGSKENIDTIVDDLSIIIGRKGWPKHEAGAALSDAFKNADTYIAAISLPVPEVDSLWIDTGARDGFLKIKRNRKRAIGFLIAIAVILSLIILASAVVAILMISEWYRWLILGGAVLVLFVGSSSLPKYVMGPYIMKRDAQIPEKFKKECDLINKFVKDLILLRRKS